MNTIKHLFTALLLLCATAATAHDFEAGGIYYNITDATNKTVKVTYRGSSYSSYDDEYTGSVVIPESVTYNGTTYSVTSIGDWAFEGCKGLTSITIPNSVTSIRSSAFYNCTGLTSITIPNSVTSIGSGAFDYCTGLTSITIPNSVTSIGSGVFDYCTGLTSIIVTAGNANYDSRDNCNAIIETATNELIVGCQNSVIPNSVTSVGYHAFYNCTGLTSITIPNSVTSIGSSAFRGCSGLTSITIPNSVTSIGYEAFWDCSGLKSVVIGNSVTSIGGGAFYNCTGLTSITIPNSVTSIGSYAFYGCSGLTSIIVTAGNANYDSRDNCNAIIETATNTLITGCQNSVIPNSVTSIGSSAFRGCRGLTNIEIPNSVTSIGESAFSWCSGLTSITIPNSVTSIGDYAFNGCDRLTAVHISDLAAWCGINFENEYANPLYETRNLYLNEKKLTELVIPDGIVEIKDFTFYNCNYLTCVVIPNSVTSIGDEAFYQCSGLTSIVIPNSVKSIGNGAFYGCDGLTSVEIPNSVTSIGDEAFSWCDGLTSITIPNSVTSIGNKAFYSCSGLKTIYNFSNLTFSKGSSGNGYVAYYADKVYNVPNGCSIEGDYIFGKPNDVNTLLYYLGNARGLTLPADYKGENYAIGASVFKGNTTITSVEIPNSVTSIGGAAFEGCTSLTAVHISDLAAWCGIDFANADANPLYYAKNLYLNGELLTELSIPTEVAEVKDYAFYNCIGVTNIDIVDGVKSIGNSAFCGCCDLETLYISNTIESIGDYAFAECNNLFEIKIGSKKAITSNDNVFSSDAYNNACLYVPTGRKDFYAKTSPWSNFIIREMDFTGIDEVLDEVKSESGKVKAIYDFQGRKVDTTNKGVYIINGKKVFVK